MKPLKAQIREDPLNPVEIVVKEPRRVKIAIDEEPKYYSGEMIEKTILVPVEDGYKEYPVKVEDTPEGHFKHINEQRSFFDQEPMTKFEFYSPEYREEWQVPFQIDGEEDVMKRPVREKDTWNKWKVQKNAFRQLTEEVAKREHERLF